MKYAKPRFKSSMLLLSAAIAATLPIAPVTLADDATELEEVIVSARKRDESLQDVPLSIQPFDAETLRRAGMQNLYDVTSRVPGMQLDVSNITDTQIFIRGIGSDIESAAADRAVGIFIDNVYMSRNSGSLTDLYDLERVEVLKGPQSLMFGKNIVGGLIHYVTAKPGEEFSAKAEATAGDYERTDFSGSVSGPLADAVYGSLTGVSRSRGGYARNTASGQDVEDLESNTLRTHLRFVPSEALEVLLSADVTRLRAGARWVDVVEAGDSDAVNWLRFDVDPPAELPGWNIPDRNAAFVNSDERKGPKNVDGYQDADLWGTSARIEWSINERMHLMSLTAYRNTEVKTREDGGGLYFDFPLQANGIPDISSAVNQFATDPLAYIAAVPDDYYDQRKDDEVEQFSQEFILTWDDGGALSWRVGAYYLNEDIERAEIVNHLFPDFNYFIALAYAGDGSAFGSEVGGTSYAYTATDADNYGVFGEFTYALTEQLSLNAGLRYAKDEKDFSVSRAGVPFDGDFTNGPFSGGDNNDWDELLPTVALSYKLNDAATFYARYAEGYKAGGWNGENAKDTDIAAVSFDPELATSYEIGGKFEFADGRARINVAAHYTEYDDLQTQQFVTDQPGIPPNNLIVNADNGTDAKGVELDFTVMPVAGLTLFGNYAWTDCEFAGSLIIDSSGTDIDGNTCRRTPEHAYNIGFQFEGSLADKGLAYLRVDYNWSDEFYFDNENLIVNDDELNLNASVGFLTADERWEISVWGKNLTDETNNAHLFDLWNTLYANYHPPRTAGVTLRWNMR